MTKCPNCRKINQSESFFCSFCGQSVPPQVTKIRNKNTDNIMVIGIVLGSILVSCFLCGIIGNFTKIKDTSAVQTANNESVEFTPPTAEDAPMPANKPQTLVSKPVKSAATTGIVITDNAGLRAEPNNNAKVIEELPLDSKIEVVKQNGAWFYVDADGQKGWLHGNMIRYDKPATSQADMPPDYATPRPTSPSPTAKPPVREPEINNSGATAKCRDGTLSYSGHRRGTCSHHGGVAVWY